MSSFLGFSEALLPDILPAATILEDAQIAAKMILLRTEIWQFNEPVWKRFHWELRKFHRCKFRGHGSTSSAEEELCAEIEKPEMGDRLSFADQIRGNAGHFLSFKVNRLEECLELLKRNSLRYSEWENDISCMLFNIKCMKATCQ